MFIMTYHAFGSDVASRRRRILAVAIGAGALVTGVGSIAASRHLIHRVGASFQPPLATVVAKPAEVAPVWDRTHRDEIVQLKSQADALAIQGKLQPAYDAYQQCLICTADHELTDPVVVATLKSAQENQSLLMSRMLVSDDSRVPTVVPPTNNTPINDSTATPLVVASAAQPATHDPQKSDPLEAGPPQPSGSAACVPNDPGAGKLFGKSVNPITQQSGGSSPAEGKPASNLEPNSNLADLFQPFSGSEPGTIAQGPPPGVIVKRSSGVSGSPGPSSEMVIVSVSARPAGSPPVTGNVDGHPFSIGGPGEPNSAVFTGLGVGPIPWSIGGQQYTYNGGVQTVPIVGSTTPTTPAAPRGNGNGTQLPTSPVVQGGTASPVAPPAAGSTPPRKTPPKSPPKLPPNKPLIS